MALWFLNVFPELEKIKLSNMELDSKYFYNDYLLNC